MAEKAYLRVVTMLCGSPLLKKELCVPLLKPSFQAPEKPLSTVLCLLEIRDLGTDC